jgi:hypothetical protein
MVNTGQLVTQAKWQDDSSFICHFAICILHFAFTSSPLARGTRNIFGGGWSTTK